jgi:hypothetical protein
VAPLGSAGQYAPSVARTIRGLLSTVEIGDGHIRITISTGAAELQIAGQVNDLVAE